MEHLPDFITIKPMPAIPLKSVFTAAGDDLIELIYQCLRFSSLFVVFVQFSYFRFFSVSKCMSFQYCFPVLKKPISKRISS